MHATPFDLNGPLDRPRAIIRRDGDEIEMVELRWGLKPKTIDSDPYRFVRSEGRTFPAHRCLIPASEFHVTRGNRRLKFMLADGNWFYLAGVWQPARDGWPASFAVITVAANPEVARFQDRHGAVLKRSQRMDWLDHLVPETELLITPPARTFDAEPLRGEPRQPTLAF